MSSLLESIEQMDLPKVAPLAVPMSATELASRLDLTLQLTSPSVPEQYEIFTRGAPSGYIHARRGRMSVSYPDPDGEELYEGPVDGFAGFTDQEREAKMLFGLGLIVARMKRP